VMVVSFLGTALIWVQMNCPSRRTLSVKGAELMTIWKRWML
jgi:hypothetical protein